MFSLKCHMPVVVVVVFVVQQVGSCFLEAYMAHVFSALQYACLIKYPGQSQSICINCTAYCD